MAMTQRSHEGGGRRGAPGLWGGLMLAALVAAYCWAPGPVGGAVGGGGGTNTTFTTSTTHHTSAGCPPHTEQSVTTTTTFGPATILIGEDQAFTFFVAAGTLNINSNTHTETFVCDAAQIPALSPVALIGMAGLLVAGGLLALHRRRA